MNWEVVVYSSATVGIIFAVIGILYYVKTAKNIKKQHARYQEMMESIKPGDDVIFAGGLMGTVQSVDPDRVFAHIKLNGTTTIKATLYSVSNVINK